MRLLFGVLAWLALFAGRAAAQRLTVESLIDLEGWKTDDGSRLLARNGGDPTGNARLRGWVGFRLLPTVDLLAIGVVDAPLDKGSRVKTQMELLEVRLLHSRAFIAEGGKILLPIGEFGPRRFSSTNPLIGVPDTYADQYAWGATVRGAVGVFDYQAALVTSPAVNLRYTPKPGYRLRPVIGVGVSAGPWLRVGSAITHGPYLGPDVDDQLPAGAAWQDFAQTVVVGDLRFTMSYVEFRFEAAWSSYEVPTIKDEVHGLGWYGELRATLSPRVFAAARFEHNKYPFVLPINSAFWVGVATTQMNGEVGLGYRLSPDALIKTSFRKDHWPVHRTGGTEFPDGYAVAVQFSLHTDIGELIMGKY